MNTSPPFLHLAVGLTGVVDEPADVAHAISVNNGSAIQVEAVVMPLVSVFFHHPTFELILTQHLTTVLYDERTYIATANSLQTTILI